MLDLTSINVVLILLVILLSLKYIIYFFEIMLRVCSQTIIRLKPINLKRKYGNWAVVTGSTSGIGKEYAKQLAKRNINIVLISRSLKKLQDTKNEIQLLNPLIDIKIIQSDFTKGKEEYKQIMEQLQEIPVGILVNNVGKLNAYPMYFKEIPEDDIWNLINTNVSAATIMTRMLIKPMLQRGKGAIVNLSSASSLNPIPLMSIYSATKIYLRYLTDIIRYENSNSGLTFQCLTPFYINTNLVKFDIYSNDKLSFPDAETFVKYAIETLGRFDTTTGYWVHDLHELLFTRFPKALLMKIFLFLNLRTRNKIINSKK